MGLIALWIFVGYRYFVHFGSETIPLIFRIIDPDFLPNDYFLNLLTETIHYRYVFVYTIAAISKIVGNVETTMVIAYLCFYYIFFFGLTSFGMDPKDSVIRQTIILTLTVFLLYYVVGRIMPGAINLLPNETTPGLFCRAILVWSVVLAMKGKFDVAMALVVISGLMQPVEALLSYPIVCVVGLVVAWEQKSGMWKPVIKACVWFLVLSGLVLFLVSESIAIRDVDQAIFGEGFRTRLAHHYLPEIDLLKWSALFLITFTGTASLVNQKQNALAISCVVGVVLVLGHYVVVKVSGNILFASLLGAKVLILPYIFWTLSLSRTTVNAIGATKQRAARLGKPITQGVLSATTITALLIIAVMGIAGYHPDELLKRQASFVLSGNYRVANDYIDRDESELFDWIARNTTPEDVILHPADDLVYIRSIAKRSSVVQNNLIGLTISSMSEWLERMTRLRGFCDRSIDDLKSIAKSYNASWIIIPIDCMAAASVNGDFRNNSWVVVPMGHHEW
jgi:hypothetical protein